MIARYLKIYPQEKYIYRTFRKENEDIKISKLTVRYQMS